MKKPLTIAAIIVVPFLAIASGCGSSENRPATQEEAKAFRAEGRASAEFIQRQQQKQAEIMKGASHGASPQGAQNAQGGARP